MTSNHISRSDYTRQIETSLKKHLLPFCNDVELAVGVQVGSAESLPEIAVIRDGNNAIAMELLLDPILLVKWAKGDKPEQTEDNVEMSINAALAKLSIELESQDGVIRLLVEPALMELNQAIGRSKTKSYKIGDAGEYIPNSSKGLRAASTAKGEVNEKIVNRTLSDRIHEDIGIAFSSSKIKTLLKKTVSFPSAEVIDLNTISYKDMVAVSPMIVANLIRLESIAKRTTKFTDRAQDVLKDGKVSHPEVIGAIEKFCSTAKETTNQFFAKATELIDSSEKRAVSIYEADDSNHEVDAEVLLSAITSLSESMSEAGREAMASLKEYLETATERSYQIECMISYLDYFINGFSNAVIRNVSRDGLIYINRMSVDLVKNTSIAKVAESQIDQSVLENTIRKRHRDFVRTGGREISNVTPTNFIEKYGLRGLQWGKYVTDSMREDFIKRSAASFSDLGDTLGLSEEDVSVLGTAKSGQKLAFAIGARGKSKALAHYERADHVINITRDSSEGTVGHEFFHSCEIYGGESLIMAALKGRDWIPEDLKEAAKYLLDSMYVGDNSDFIERLKKDLENTKSNLEFFLRIINEDKAKLDADLKEKTTELRKLLSSDNKSYNKELNKLKVERMFRLAKIAGFEKHRDSARKHIYNLEKMIPLFEKGSKDVFSLGAYEMRDIKRYFEKNKSFNAIYKDELEKTLESGKLITPSDYIESSEKVDVAQGKKNGYWSSVPEMGARAFESFLATKLREANRSNNYLVDQTVLSQEGSSPFPKNEKELSRINESIEIFLKILIRYKKRQLGET